MQTPVTVVMLLHDAATEADQPVCKVLTGCSWRETRRTSASGDPQRVVHVRLPPAPGYLPYPQWARLPTAEKAAHWTLKRGSKLLCGAVRSLTEAEYAALQKAQFALAQEAARLIDSYVPFDTGSLKNSVNQASKYDEGLLVYNTPYARKQYYLHAEGTDLRGETGLRGSYWGQRAIADIGEHLALYGAKAVTTFWGGMGHL